MFLTELGTLVTAIVVVGGGALLAGYRIWERIRGRHRNDAGKCAYCAGSLEHVSPTDLYYIGGRKVCAPCADRFRARLVRGFVGLACTVGVVGLFAGALVYFGVRAPTPVMWAEVGAVLTVLGGALGATGLVVAKLKRDNRQALALDAAGLPALPAKDEIEDRFSE